jgi:glutaredoxin
MMTGVEIEVLVVPGCPHAAAAALLVRQALDELDLAATAVEVIEIGTLAEASRRNFVGSPTVLINGVDPFARPGQPSALACRFYSTGPEVSPLPDPDSLRDALLNAHAAD